MTNVRNPAGNYYGCDEWAREWSEEVVASENRPDWDWEEAHTRLEEGLACRSGARTKNDCAGDCGGCELCEAGKFQSTAGQSATCKGEQTNAHTRAIRSFCFPALPLICIYSFVPV